MLYCTTTSKRKMEKNGYLRSRHRNFKWIKYYLYMVITIRGIVHSILYFFFRQFWCCWIECNFLSLSSSFSCPLFSVVGADSRVVFIRYLSFILSSEMIVSVACLILFEMVSSSFHSERPMRTPNKNHRRIWV